MQPGIASRPAIDGDYRSGNQAGQPRQGDFPAAAGGGKWSALHDA